MTPTRPTFDWDDGASWLADIPRYAEAVLTANLRAQLQRTRPDCWSDNMAWIGGEETANQFEERFVTYYGSVRGFHGCRPTSISSYLDKGLLGQSQNEIESTFRAIFRDLPQDRLGRAIQALAHRGSSERGKIYFCATANELTERCGHYLLQGSEYLMCLAAALSEQADSRERYEMRLRAAGTPTIFDVDIPIEYLPPPQTKSLTRMVLSHWGQVVSGNHLGINDGPCYIVHRDIEPHFIRTHSHPAVVRDPHRGRSKCRAASYSCDVCCKN